jgi:hypothetical protein
MIEMIELTDLLFLFLLHSLPLGLGRLSLHMRHCHFLDAFTACGWL